MKPVIYITPEGSVNLISDYPEEPEYCQDIKCQDTHCLCVIDRVCYHEAITAAKKNSIPLDNNYLQAKALFELFENMGVPAAKLRQWLMEHKGEVVPVPDQYKVEIKERIVGTASLAPVAVLSPLKPQEDKLISETKDMKDIKDYLHLYHGKYWSFEHQKLELRPTSDITDSERLERGKAIIIYGSKFIDAEYHRWMLDKGFDLFGLIEAGLAIDKTKLNSQTNENKEPEI